jgi:uncharacterized cupin superfamily protein
MKQVCALAVAALLVTSVQAQTPSKILRFEPNGPSGEGLKGYGQGDSKIYVYYGNVKESSAGVWSSTDFSGKMRTVKNTEFIKILEGQVTFETQDGHETTFKAGDCVLIPRGTEFSWKRTVNEKEYYVVFDRAAEGAPVAMPNPMFVRMEVDGPEGKGLTSHGRTKAYGYYKSPDGSSAGVWETAPYTAPDFHQTKYAELMVFLKGNVTLSTPDGQVEHFKAGEVALVPRGISYKWSSDTARKFWVIFDSAPKASDSATASR